MCSPNRFILFFASLFIITLIHSPNLAAEDLGFAGLEAASLGASAGTQAAEAEEKLEWEDVEVDLSGFYLNAKCTVRYELNGKKHKISHGSATTDKLVDALQKVRQKGGKVYNIEIKGHGAPELQQMAGGTFIIASNKMVIVQLKGEKDLDITNLLKIVCKRDVAIELNGCKTGRGEGSVAEEFSRALPGSTVAGGSLYQAGVPFTSKSWGTKIYYKNGKRVSKWWYVID